MSQKTIHGWVLLALLALPMPSLTCEKLLDANQNVGQAETLELHQSIVREIGPGQTDNFKVQVSAGQFLHVVVKKIGVEVSVGISDPTGHRLVTADDPRNRAFGLERVSIVANDDGLYSLEIKESPWTSATGRYQIELRELHDPTADDRNQLQAENEFYASVLNERYQDRQKKLEAINGYLHAANLWHSLHDGEEAFCLHRVGIIYVISGESQKALDYLNRALPLWHAFGDRAGEATTLNAIGATYERRGDRQQAIAALNKSLALTREVGDRMAESVTLQNIGGTYLKLGDRQKALDSFAEALTLNRALGDREGEAGDLQNLGLLYKDLGESEKALSFLNQSLELGRKVGDKSNEAYALENIAFVYRDLGENQKAIEFSGQALAMLHGLGDRGLEAGSLYNIGFAYSNLKEKQKAIDFTNQALSLFRSMEDRAGEGSALDLEGFVLANAGESEKALDFYDQALAAQRAIKDRPQEAWTLIDMGNAYTELGQRNKAIGYYVQAIQVARENPDPWQQAALLTDLMKYWQAAQEPGLAIFFGKQAINQLQSIRKGNAGLEQGVQRSYLSKVSSDYRGLADLLIANGRLPEAEQVLSLLKEQEYFDFIRRDAEEAPAMKGHANMNPAESEAEKRYEEVADKLVSIGVERGNLLTKETLTAQEKQRLDQLEHEISVGNIQFEKFLGDLAQEFKAKPSAALRVEELRESQGLMEDLRDLPPGTVAIFTVLGEDKYRTILRTPDVQKAYEVAISDADLSRKVSAFRQVLLDPKLDPRPRAEELYRILVGPMEEDLRHAHAETLMWSLDGTLRYLPVAALYDGHRYLIERYRVSVMTLASTARLKERWEGTRRGVGFGVTKASEGAQALPWVSAELSGIISTHPGDSGALQGQVELDDAFTQASMREALLKHYAVVHIASHFRFQPGNESQSYLLLGNGGHLSLSELRTSANLFGGVQLLTLSACNTGMGDGAEIEGFGTLAQRQGARAIVASLWPVADESTSILMQRFYRIWQSSTSMTKLEALRRAQLELLHGLNHSESTAADRGVSAETKEEQVEAPPFAVDPKLPFAHPYYWAPFFLMGNWL